MECWNSPLTEFWTPFGPQAAQAWPEWTRLMRGRSLLGQSSQYLAMTTRPVLTKPFKAWSMLVILIPVYDILISSQSRQLSAPNRHALNYWLAYTMTDTYLLMFFLTVRPIAIKFGWDKEDLSCVQFRKFHWKKSAITFGEGCRSFDNCLLLKIVITNSEIDAIVDDSTIDEQMCHQNKTIIGRDTVELHDLNCFASRFFPPT